MCGLVGSALSKKNLAMKGRLFAFEKIRSIDRDQFIQDIKHLSLMNHEDFLDVLALSDCYENTLRSLTL